MPWFNLGKMVAYESLLFFQKLQKLWKLTNHACSTWIPVFSWKYLFYPNYSIWIWLLWHRHISYFYNVCLALAEVNYLVFWNVQSMQCMRHVWSTGEQEILLKIIVELMEYFKPFRYSAPLRRKQRQCLVSIWNGELCSPQGKLLFHLCSWNNQIRKVLHLRDWKLRRKLPVRGSTSKHYLTKSVQTLA